MEMSATTSIVALFQLGMQLKSPDGSTYIYMEQSDARFAKQAVDAGEAIQGGRERTGPSSKYGAKGH